jgi:hypothetical protein
MKIHESHVIQENGDAPDPHSPLLSCAKCWGAVCLICYDMHELKEDDDLALPCDDSWLK